MLFTSVRVRPWREPLSRSSSGRVTVGPPSFFDTVIGATTARGNVPFGPLTPTQEPSQAPSPPAGTPTSRRWPPRHRRARRRAFFRCATCQFSLSGLGLPDVGEDFPTHALLVGLTVGQQALAGRDDRHAEATEHLGQARVLGVHPQTG